MIFFVILTTYDIIPYESTTIWASESIAHLFYRIKANVYIRVGLNFFED